MLTSASEHLARQRGITRRTLIAARAARFGSLDALMRLVTAGQVLAATDAAEAVPLMLAEQGLDADPSASVTVTALAGVASNGMPLDGLLDRVRDRAIDAHRFDRFVVTQVQDAARVSASLAMQVRPAVTGYVRMLVAPSCSRCVILAGRHYSKSAGFQRHPLCDCRHIPASENTWGDLATDPRSYFDSLTATEQDRVFTAAGAQAIRDGADMSRIVNARKGMWTAQGSPRMATVGGRDVRTTTEATTKRGIGRKVRLMPESIYEIADTDAERLRLLRVHGYIR